MLKLKFNDELDYWRKKYLIPAINANKKIALIGIGDARNYLSVQNDEKLSLIWDPYRLSRSSKNYCVYDIDRELVDLAKQIGIQAKIHDATKDILEETYDFIFASDVIEHVDNPIAFLKNLSNSLHINGVMVITTPNSIYWRNFITDSYQEYKEHNFTFNKKHLQNLAQRNELNMIEISSFQTTGGVNSFYKVVLQNVHNIMAMIGRANSLVMVVQKYN